MNRSSEQPVQLLVKRLDSGLPMPSYAHEGDAGLDLHAADDATIQPGQRALVGTGIAIAIPEGFAGFVQPRSGLAWRAGLTFVNTPGLIDCHFRGEIRIIAHNTDAERSIEIRRGERIGQLVIQRVERARLVEVAELPQTVRGEAGFGSSGV